MLIALTGTKSGMPRALASVTSETVARILRAELNHETELYEQAEEIQSFLKNGSWEFGEVEGDEKMMLAKEVDERIVQVEWELSMPFDPLEEDDAEAHPPVTDFSVTILNKDRSAGISFLCTTQSGSDNRYVISHVKSFSSAEEKDNPSAYIGPDFEDVEEKLQDAWWQYLAEIGATLLSS